MAVKHIRNEVINDLRTHINNCNLSVISDCLEFVKISSKSEPVKAVLKKFDYPFEDKIKIIYLKGAKKSSNKKERAYPIQFFEDPENRHLLKNINVYELIQPFDTILEQIFDMQFKNTSYLVEDNSFPDVCSIVYTPQFEYKDVKFKNLYNLLTDTQGFPKKGQCISENFDYDRPYRFFLDIEQPNDMKDLPEIIPIEQIKQNLTEVMNRITRVHLGAQFKILECIQDSTGLQKFRIYTNVAMHLRTMKFIAKNLRSPFIDLSPYSVMKQFRMCNTYKCIEIGKDYKRYYPVSKNRFMNTVLQYIENCIILPNSIILTGHHFYTLNNTTNINGYIIPFDKDLYTIKENDKGWEIKFKVSSWACPSNPEIIHESHKSGAVYKTVDGSL